MSGWESTENDDARLDVLMERGYMRSDEGAACMVPEFTDLPTAMDKYILSFEAFHERGFGVPATWFLQALLLYYQLELHHLMSGSILHLAAFMMLCEAYLGVDPHFLLRKYFLTIEGVGRNPIPPVGGI
jgi:hypothetical protein